MSTYRDRLVAAELARSRGDHSMIAHSNYEAADRALAVRDAELDRLSQENDRLAAEVARLETEAQLAEAKKKIKELSSSLDRVRQVCDDTEAHCSGQRLDTPSWVATVRSAISSPTEDPVWLCIRCGSSRWVAASLTGPVDYGGRAIKQCVSCGYYSNDPATKINPPPGDTPEPNRSGS